ncbi:MaoC family dehydratase [Streptomyces sp. NPDC033538]|uniref:MaoC family dehydratase n=1 Tax=Streptomyces sp. NPDC033538 TaxID=3155367 RepID=UPI0033CB8D6B
MTQSTTHSAAHSTTHSATQATTPSATAKVAYGDVEVGTELPARSFPVSRATLVRYAGASGDFNPIHWNEKFAKEVGLPDVIAHGMFTMAEAIRVVTDWIGDPAAVVEYGVRFTRPVVVPNDDQGAVIEVTGKVAAKLDDNTVRVDLTATSAGQKVLGMSRAVVRLA